MLLGEASSDAAAGPCLVESLLQLAIVQSDVYNLIMNQLGESPLSKSQATYIYRRSKRPTLGSYGLSIFLSEILNKKLKYTYIM